MEDKKELLQLKEELENQNHGYVEVYQDGKLLNIWEKEKNVYMQLLGFLYNKYILKLNKYKIKIKYKNDYYVTIKVDEVESYGNFIFIFNNIAINNYYLNFNEIEERIIKELKENEK